MEDSDEALVAKCQQGSLRAFESLVGRYQPRIFGFLEKQLKNREDAEDLTQRTFLQAYQSLARFDSKYRFSPWLFTIARRQGIDFIRKVGSRQKQLDRLSAEPPPPFVSGPSDLLEQKENVDEIWRWIWANLDARSCEVLWLRIQEELDLPEIARVMNLTRSHVKVILYRSRKTLLKDLSQGPDRASKTPETQFSATPIA